MGPIRSRRRKRTRRIRMRRIELPEVVVGALVQGEGECLVLEAEACLDPWDLLGQGIWTAQSASALDAMMKGWAGDCSSTEANSNPQAKDSTASNDGATPSAHAEAHSAAHAAHSAAHAAHSAAHAAATNDFAAMNNAFSGMNMTGSEDYLKNVGNFVAAALDPLGIDVKIDIETPDGKQSTQTSSKTRNIEIIKEKAAEDS